MVASELEVSEPSQLLSLVLIKIKDFEINNDIEVSVFFISVLTGCFFLTFDGDLFALKVVHVAQQHLFPVTSVAD